MKTRYYLLKRVFSREERQKRRQEYIKKYRIRYAAFCKRLAKKQRLQIEKSQKTQESQASSNPAVAACVILDDDEERAHQSDSQDCTVVEEAQAAYKVFDFSFVCAVIHFLLIIRQE